MTEQNRVKAILVIDKKPDRCVECPLNDPLKDVGWCVPLKQELGIGMMQIGILQECPLKSIDLDAIEEENPYRIIGQRETYSQYNEGWQDVIGRIRRELGL